MTSKNLEELELDLIINSIYKQYGYDFKDYARASFKRRVEYFATANGFKYISELIPKILHDSTFLNLFLNAMSISVTEMFRDPWVFKTIREEVLSTLKIFPQINIWHAGCSTGEEVYSLAIILKEEGLLDYCQIYATDFNNHSLEVAKEGIYDINKLKTYTKNFFETGGKNSLSDYYHVKYGKAKFDGTLQKNITFSTHNLVSDKVFGKMNIILCRNVLIYFKQNLQEKVLTLFRDSLSSKGYLVLGEKESIEFSSVYKSFDKFPKAVKIYRMK